MGKIFRKVNLVDVINERIIEKVNVFIEGSTIVQILNDEKITDKDNWEVNDYDGCFIVSGLIDLHTHLIWSGRR